MKTARFLVLITACLAILLLGTSCGMFGPKYGCPANGKNTGAERVLTGEKVPKAKRFKA